MHMMADVWFIQNIYKTINKYVDTHLHIMAKQLPIYYKFLLFVTTQLYYTQSLPTA